MDIQFGTANVGKALLLMLLGMVGIFIVMFLLYGVVALLNKLTGKKADDKDKNEDNQ